MKVEITDHEHLRNVWFTLGLLEAKGILEKLQKEHRLPGCALATATIATIAESERSKMLVDNIKLALKHGFDLNSDKNLAMLNNSKATWLTDEDEEEKK